jgi:hypothetical protein
MDEKFTRYEHQPAHPFRPDATYVVTARRSWTALSSRAGSEVGSGWLG